LVQRWNTSGDGRGIGMSSEWNKQIRRMGSDLVDTLDKWLTAKNYLTMNKHLEEWDSDRYRAMAIRLRQLHIVL